MCDSNSGKAPESVRCMECFFYLVQKAKICGPRATYRHHIQIYDICTAILTLRYIAACNTGNLSASMIKQLRIFCYDLDSTWVRVVLTAFLLSRSLAKESISALIFFKFSVHVGCDPPAASALVSWSSTFPLSPELWPSLTSHTSPGDWPRELFKSSKDPTSLVDSIKRNWSVLDFGFLWATSQRG